MSPEPPSRRADVRVPVVGVEHEYRIRCDGALVDARTIVDDLGFGERLDPGDPHAHRTTWGAVVTADGAEIEVATPPIPVDAQVLGRLAAFAAQGRHQVIGALRAHLGPGVALEGYSTHLNVEVDDDRVVDVGWLVTCRFAPAIMLLLDAASSPGLFVRPRCGRLELGGEYADGDHLDAALLLAIGATLAADAVVRGDAPLSGLPAPVLARVESTVQRYGWYIDHAAFGTDLYEAGRGARLRRRWRRRMTADAHLHEAWRCARAALRRLPDAPDDAVASTLVEGDDPLPRVHPSDVDPSAPATPPSDPHGDLLAPVERPGFTARPIVATWDSTVFAIEPRDTSQPTSHLTVERDELPTTLAGLRAGRFDDTLGRTHQ